MSRAIDGRLPDELDAYVLSDGLDDWVMLGGIAQAAVAFGLAESVLDAREITLGSLERLLAEHLIEVGDIHRDDGRFHSWKKSSSGTIERLRELIADDDENMWYSAAWISLTEKGKAVAAQLDANEPVPRQ